MTEEPTFPPVPKTKENWTRARTTHINSIIVQFTKEVPTPFAIFHMFHIDYKIMPVQQIYLHISHEVSNLHMPVFHLLKIAYD